MIFYARPEPFDGRTFGTPAALGLLIVVFAANLPAVWLPYSLVEKPMMRGWSRSRKRPEPSAPQRTELAATGKTV
ncbi:hypothetical protein ACH4E8_34040 [Streptomyces sp. NPDC017979]|uniref:hypothetical protein n=1 Tax=Streptomyces sp. NPDC017979 TaxID=3365024 RepID=UPI0037AF5B63